MFACKKILHIPLLLLVISCNNNQYVDSEVFESNLPAIDGQQFNHADAKINYFKYSGGTMSNEHVVFDNEKINDTYYYHFLNNKYVCDHDNGGAFAPFLSLANTIFDNDEKILSTLGIEQAKQYERKFKIKPLEIDYFFNDSISNNLEKTSTKITAAFRFDEFGYPTYVSANQLTKYSLVYGGKTITNIKTEIKIALSITWRNA